MQAHKNNMLSSGQYMCSGRAVGFLSARPSHANVKQRIESLRHTNMHYCMFLLCMQIPAGSRA
jgi:hypothetical protein